MRSIASITAIILLTLLAPAWCAQSNPIKEKYDEAMKAFTAKDYTAAIELFEAVIQMHPGFAQPYTFLAMAKKELGASDEEVLELLEKSAELDPNFALAHDNLGKMYYGMGRFAEAKEHAQKALELSPNLLSARYSLAWVCLLGLGETREAIEHFEAGLAQQKTDYGQYGLGMAYFMDHQRGRVLEMITNLRMEGNEKLASDLEEMIRKGRYLPPNGIQSLINPKPLREEGETVQEVKEAPANMNFPVRLSGKLDGSAPGAPVPAEQAVITGADRIRQLQRNLPPSAY